ncbi:endospore germination permease [Paenibacillus sp. FSL R5-0527]|uniref:GerAB/ArcD/ProY family transporter n=1 Tax=Paenibacillus sp. FSL R5-0527 TaxID=2975321 RepID=UPI00097B30B6|nr:spore gernimation protein [Paenibacillus macerans]
MKHFEYGDREVGTLEVFASVANMVIGFGVLMLPRSIVEITKSVDGWISIVIGGACALTFTWILSKLISRFPKQNVYSIAAVLLGRPAAVFVTLLFALYMLLFTGYETRGVATISRIYLFDRTPIEVISLVFLLVLVYGVAGPSAALLRLNLIFLPIVVLLLTALILMNIGFFEFRNLKPFFAADWRDVLYASKESVFSFMGFDILLFYNAFINRPLKIAKAASLGLLLPFFLYLLVFVFTIGVFGVDVTGSVLYPTAELAKEVQVPGGFFERFESIFFSVWVMTLFSTAAMAFDVSLLALESVFKKANRFTLILWLTPVIYLAGMQPQNLLEIRIFGEWISYAGIGFGMVVPTLLLLLSLLRRRKKSA